MGGGGGGGLRMRMGEKGQEGGEREREGKVK